MLLSKLVRHQPTIYFDWDAFEIKNAIYDPEFEGHWNCLSTAHVLTRMNDLMIFDTLGPSPEDMLFEALQATRRDVEWSVDNNHQIFPPNVRDNIRLARRIYDHNHTIQRANNPFENDAEMASWNL